MKTRTNAFRRVAGALLASSRHAHLRLRGFPLPSPAHPGHKQQLGPLSVRHFASTRSFKDQFSQTTTFEDPSRKGLFYHLVPPPTPLSDTRPVFALSFLANPPPSSESSTVLGWLPAETPGDDREAGLNDFVQNRRFLPLLHEAIASGLAEAVDDIQASGALQLGEGWMHIHDDRNLPPLNRIGDPDDIIGSVQVEGGKILAETYQAMPSYRVCTADGVIQLTEGLTSKLRALLDARAREESLKNLR
ncbi:hypothetical protein EDB83DRAFT_2344878 [Lactarius deliciosus]|nr:hypothetical protein EDB83DRAFT_2344878 [Lactarius deliciosus]